MRMSELNFNCAQPENLVMVVSFDPCCNRSVIGLDTRLCDKLKWAKKTSKAPIQCLHAAAASAECVWVCV